MFELFLMLTGCGTLDAAENRLDEQNAHASALATAGAPLIRDSSTCSGRIGLEAGSNRTLQMPAEHRTYRLDLPSASHDGPRPLMVAFHGTGESGSSFASRARLQDFVQRGWIVLAPDGVGHGDMWPIWDAMRAPGNDAPNRDLEFVDELIDCLAAGRSVDSTRIVAVGHSAGGIMTNRVLRERSELFAGGIAGSGLIDFTGTEDDALDGMNVITTWGGSNDFYAGSTPDGTTVPGFSFVEQAALTARFWDRQSGVGASYCRGDNLGHAWLSGMNDAFSDFFMNHPKGTRAHNAPSDFGSGAQCGVGPVELPSMPEVECGAATTCESFCDTTATCLVENGTLAFAMAPQLEAMGFGVGTCGTCVSTCNAMNQSAEDAAVLECFSAWSPADRCEAGIEGAMPFVEAFNACCTGANSGLCAATCEVLQTSEPGQVLFTACDDATVEPPTEGCEQDIAPGPGVLDCNGTCAPAAWVGDGYCDDGSYSGVFLDCSAHASDGGDCP